MKKFNEWNKNSKQIFWVTIAALIVGLLNVVPYAVVSSMNLVVVRSLAYLFWVVYMVAVCLPMLFVLFKRKVDIWFVILLDLFFALAILVGSLWRVYILLDGYDKFVHTIFGLTMAILAFYLFFNGSEKNKGTGLFMFVFLVAFSMLCGAAWEIFEFTSDSIITNLDAQVTQGLVGRLAIYNTMFDLICDLGGALLGAILTFLLEKRKVSKRQPADVENK